MNNLKQFEDFEDILSNYAPSNMVRELANTNRMVLLAGVTSSGRNTVIKELLKTGEFHYMVSDTTRTPRTNDGETEQDGVEYHFKTEEEFLKRLKLGLYLEAALIHNQQVSGIGIEELLTVSAQHEVGVTDIENSGAHNILEVAPGSLVFFLIPPNFNEWMTRLTRRGTLDQEEIQRRLASAENELEEAIESDSFTVLINNEYAQTARDISDIAFGSESSQNTKMANDAAWKLLNELKQAVHS